MPIPRNELTKRFVEFCKTKETLQGCAMLMAIVRLANISLDVDLEYGTNTYAQLNELMDVEGVAASLEEIIKGGD